MKTIAKELLEKAYFEKLKEYPILYAGVELEFPIINLDGSATNHELLIKLLDKFTDEEGFTITQSDFDDNTIEIMSEDNDDTILFECGYNTLEIAFARTQDINEIAKRFKKYFSVIQPYLLENNLSLTGLGVNPFWNKNDNTPVNSSRYRMLREYLLMAKNMDSEFRLHSHYEYPTYIQGSQVQFDVSKKQLAQIINLFNKIEPAKAWLFANSYMWNEIWNTGVSRDILWEDSMHGILKENVGVYDHEFMDVDEVLESLADTAIFTVERESETYYFQPLTVSEYFNREEIKAFDIEGREAILVPDVNDLKLHRSYKYQSLTKRGTLEFRSICTQPLNATFSTAAFHLGLLENLSSLDTLLNKYFFFEKYGFDIKKLRRKFAFFNLSEEEKDDVIKFSNDLLNISKEGLEKRGYGEEKYLLDLVRRVEKKENPAEYGIRLLKEGKSLVDISREFANIDALK